MASLSEDLRCTLKVSEHQMYEDCVPDRVESKYHAYALGKNLVSPSAERLVRLQHHEIKESEHANIMGR